MSGICTRGIFRGQTGIHHLNSAKIALYTGGVCLKYPNAWHFVMFGKYCRVFSATGAPYDV